MRILIYTFCSIVGLYEVKIGSIIVVIANKDGISCIERHSQTVSRFDAVSQSQVFVAVSVIDGCVHVTECVTSR